MGNTYFVPVQASKAGTLAQRTGRLRSGELVGLAFTSEVSFRLTMGPAGQWARLDGQALKDMLAPLGVERFWVDPVLGSDPALPEPDLHRGPHGGQPTMRIASSALVFDLRPLVGLC